MSTQFRLSSPVPRRLLISAVAVVITALFQGCCGTRPPPPAEPEPTAQAEEETVATPDPDIIPRDVLFGNPERTATRISPDGTRISFLAPLDGVLNVFVGPLDDPDRAEAVTHDKGRGIRTYFWAYTNTHIVYLQDAEGDENWRVHSVDLESGEEKDLTPLEDVHATLEEVSQKFPEEILIGLNDRNPSLHDIYRVNITTGERRLIQENPGFAGFLCDDDYRVRLAALMTDDGGTTYYTPAADRPKASRKPKKSRNAPKKGDQSAGDAPSSAEAGPALFGWELFMEVDMTDSLTTMPVGFDKSGQVLYLLDSRDRDTAAFSELDMATGESTIRAENDKADLQDLMIHPTEKTVEAAGFTYIHKEWQILDPDLRTDFDVLEQVAEGDFEVVSRTLADDKWIVAYLQDDGPVRYYLYHPKDKTSRFLFTNRPALEPLSLASMKGFVITARDDLELVSYLTLPVESDPDGDGRPDRPLPLVLTVHGGPWARDVWGYDATHQWLANRGYAVLSVNFRGSTGFGKAFINAGNLEWAGKMHDDLIDAVRYAVSEQIADPEKIAIMGGSYGGYATLVGLTFTPKQFACGVDIVGPSNLQTLLETIPPYWSPMIALFAKRVGDHRTEAGRELLMSRSPLTFAHKIERPLLIAQGANDPRVKQSESDQITEAMTEKGIPVTYVLYPDEGHGFARPENRQSFYAVTERFLAECLGGKAEPIGDDFEGSTITVPVGADQIPGLESALTPKQR